MPNKNGVNLLLRVKLLLRLSPLSGVSSRHVYGFVLQAVKGDKATADAIFEDYLAGKLSEELLSVSRRCVSKDQARSSNRDIEEGWRSDKIKSGRGAGVSEDALITAHS